MFQDGMDLVRERGNSMYFCWIIRDWITIHIALLEIDNARTSQRPAMGTKTGNQEKGGYGDERNHIEK
jgi:hypothetical protein